MNRSNIPTLPANTPQAVVDSLAEYNAAHDALERAEAAIPGDPALREAEDADRKALADAVREGKSATDVGTPNVDKWRRAREANRLAAQTLNADVQEVTRRTAQVLADHRAELLAAAVPDAQRAADHYRKSLAAVTDARERLNQATTVVAWVLGIGQRSPVPNIGAHVDPLITTGMRQLAYQQVRDGLERDADRIDSMLTDDVKRLIDAALEDARSTAADAIAARRSAMVR